jgi:hypothetical protein
LRSASARRVRCLNRSFVDERASADHLDASAGSRTQMIRRDFFVRQRTPECSRHDSWFGFGRGNPQMSSVGQTASP